MVSKWYTHSLADLKISLSFTINECINIQNNQGRGKGHQLKPKAEADNPYQDLDCSGYHKTESNNIVLLYIEHKNLEATLLLFH